MANDYEPWVSADKEIQELTIRVVIIGILLGAVMTAANAYLGLYVGMTVSASIPAAVMSMLILRGFKFKDVTILENNAVQTMASAGESLAAGVIFTVPALLVIGLWVDIQWFETLSIAVLGGLLGTMFTIALRHLFIVEEALPYPEGVACKEVLVAGEQGGSGLIAIVYALGIGAIYGWFVKGFRVTHQHVEGGINFLGTRLYGGAELSLALLSVGYIVGLRIASFIFLGGVIGFGILVPLFGMIRGWPGSGDIVSDFYTIWSSEIRYIGVGAMIVGGVYTLWSMKDTIKDGLVKALKAANSEDDTNILRTEKDIPLDKVILACGVLVLLTFFFYWYATGSVVLALSGALFLAAVSFFFAAVAGYIAGVVGSSNSPVSGMTIATMIFTIGLVWVIGDLILGLETKELMLATMFIAAIVATSAAIAGDVMQDLKTGHMVGATPFRQQTAEVIGVLVGAIVIGPVLSLLHKAFQISKTACLATNERIESGIVQRNIGGDSGVLYNCDNALIAPQAELIGAIVQGAFGGGLNLQMVILGAIIAVFLIRLKMPVMSVAIGIYLPLSLSVPIMAGGLISHFLLSGTRLRVDGNLENAPSKKAKEAMKEVQDRGVLIGAGFIAGESLMGVLLAVFIVANIDPAELLGVGTLGNALSMLFFGWFVSVFITLAAQSMPKNGNLVTDSLAVVKQAWVDFIEAFKLPPQDE
ncbi:MAG TPA: oligopeptide transporter, OPT family [Candidatus Poseidoniales archaeon]|nr:MAG TPA: oligopeptide transporter, OPT family [Candidatus Poseidoniales archaeon]HII62395.1 oligopeptide transporter, OPT family [Candidatus Poseidoniaceae archaeon]